jgi:hypothetical protein
MRYFFLLVYVTWLCTLSVNAQQQTPKAEVYSGYSFLRMDGDFNTRNLNGWQLSVNTGFPRKIGFEIAADFTGHYGKFNMHTATVGPRFILRAKAATVYSHFMYGVAHIRGDLNQSLIASNKRSETSFTDEIGFGFDIKVNDRVAICPMRFDIFLTRWGKDQSQLHTRYSSGLVFRFGKK